MENENQNLLTIKQASKFLNCHPNTLRMWERKGIIEPVRFGVRKDRRYLSDELEKFMRNENEQELKDVVLPSSYDLTRIDMTGTHYEGLIGDVLAGFKTYGDLDKQTIDKFDFKKFLNDYNARIENFPRLEMDKFPTLSEKILHIITAARYRNGSLETINLEKYKPSFIEKIEYFVERNEPIKLMLPAFPFKIANPLKSGREDADLAEVAAFCRFNEINRQIKKFYKPGAQFHIFHDGHLYYRHFLHEIEDADRYFASLKRFVEQLGLEQVIILRDAFEELKKIDNFDSICAQARKEITNLWLKDKFSNEKVRRIIQSAHYNIKLSNAPHEVLYRINFAEDWDLSSEEKKLKKEIDKRAEKCAFEYMVVQHALEKADFFNKMVNHGIRLTVHPKEGHIGIYLVKRKTHLLPWMGVGVIKNNGEVSVHYESELISNGKYRPVFIKGEEHPFYYKEAETIYKGTDQFRSFFSDTVDSLKEGDFYWAFAFHTEYLNKDVREILTNTHKALAEKSIEDKAICKKDMFETISKAYSDNSNIKIKAVNEEIPTGVIILKNRIINLLWGEEPSAFEIRDREIVSRYQKYFKELWKK